MLTAKMKRRTTKNKRPKLLISVANDKIRDSQRSLPVLLKTLSPRLTGDLRKSELEDQSQEKEAKRSRAGASKFNPRCGLCAPGGEYSWEIFFFGGGGCSTVLQILLQTKKSHFFTPVFRPGL